MRAYIIDDAPIIVSIIGFILNSDDIGCAYTLDVTEDTYKEIIEYSPDIILLDLRLKDVEGTEVAKKLHSFPELENIPIIAISNCDNLFEKVMIESRDFADYVQKPVVRDELLPLVKKYATLGRIFNLGRQVCKGSLA